jgi:hypothetical protein
MSMATLLQDIALGAFTDQMPRANMFYEASIISPSTQNGNP